MTESDHDSKPLSSLLPDDAQCFRCGYLLRGLIDNICPECGFAFDPTNPESYVSPSRPVKRNVFGRTPKPFPPGKIATRILLVMVIALLIDFSNPGQASLDACIWQVAAIFTVFCFAVSWFTRLVSWLIIKGTPEAPPREPFRKWALIPLLLFLLMTNWLYPWAAYVRFQMSKSAFESAAKKQTKIVSGSPQRIGLYVVRWTRVEPNGDMFFEVGTSFIDAFGFWYIANEPPSLTGKWYTEHMLTNHWYIGGERF
ncbi:MAG: hypothetical protein KDA54_02030 [Phycisphaerales bacterium]|nr:hypothetical protein [Phycisphaerales bacterium]